MTKRHIPLTCPECERAMKLYAIEDENASPIWRCVCGHSEPVADPRYSPPFANVRVFEDDERQTGPI